ncbi:hypothetical protein BJX62DRAFT_240316 [Aspergillus germanicus]
MIKLLLSTDADVSLRGVDGSTPLSLAVDAGGKEVVRALVRKRGLATRDSTGNNIAFRAMLSGRWDITELLAPRNWAETLPADVTRACQQIWVRCADYPETLGYKDSQMFAVSSLLYEQSTGLPSIEPGSLGFRWIHFPANNPAWIEAALINWCLEAGVDDIESALGLLSSLNHCHCGQYPHSRHHQPACKVYGKNLWVSMPYLSYDFVLDFQKLQDTIQQVANSTVSDQQSAELSRDELLIKAYKTPGGQGLHFRRTLDQFFYPNFDTRLRDRDQVVCRYQKGIGSEDPTLYMVDQMWILILEGRLVITSLPQRLDRTAPMEVRYNPQEYGLDVARNIMNGVFPDIHGVVLETTGRCCGIFDRHVPLNEAYLFLSMFEASIGRVAGREA